MYSLAHVHLLLNHVPVIVTALALLLLAVALWRDDDTLVRTGLVFLVGAAVSALPTYLTGESAEDAVENLPGVTEELIDKHQDIALIAAIVLGVLGVAALWVIWRYRKPARIPRQFAVWLLAATVVSAGLMAYTGLLGGQIRHTEIRPGFVAPPEGAGEEGEHE